jgi:hypothetical protein
MKNTDSSDVAGHRRAARIAAALAVPIATAAIAGLAGASPAFASTYLGGVDMQRACDTQYLGYGLRAVVLDQHNAFSWKCRSPWGYTAGIDVNRECVTQYGGGASAGLVSQTNPYSWYCKR